MPAVCIGAGRVHPVNLIEVVDGLEWLTFEKLFRFVLVDWSNKPGQKFFIQNFTKGKRITKFKLHEDFTKQKQTFLVSKMFV